MVICIKFVRVVLSDVRFGFDWGIDWALIDHHSSSAITTTCYLGAGNAEVTFSPWGLIPALSNESGSIFATAAAGDEVVFDWDCSDDEVLIEGGSCNAQIIA